MPAKMLNQMWFMIILEISKERKACGREVMNEASEQGWVNVTLEQRGTNKTSEQKV